MTPERLLGAAYPRIGLHQQPHLDAGMGMAFERGRCHHDAVDRQRKAPHGLRRRQLRPAQHGRPLQTDLIGRCGEAAVPGHDPPVERREQARQGIGVARAALDHPHGAPSLIPEEPTQRAVMLTRTGAEHGQLGHRHEVVGIGVGGMERSPARGRDRPDHRRRRLVQVPHAVGADDRREFVAGASAERCAGRRDEHHLAGLVLHGDDEDVVDPSHTCGEPLVPVDQHTWVVLGQQGAGRPESTDRTVVRRDVELVRRER